VSVAAQAAIVSKGMKARQAIMDYRTGKYPGPDGEYVFGVPKYRDLKSPQSDDTGNAPLEIAIIRSTGSGRHTTGGHRSESNSEDFSEIAGTTSTTITPTDVNGEEIGNGKNEFESPMGDLDMVLLVKLLDAIAENDREGVEAFEAIFMSSCFPGTEVQWGMSQRDTADMLKVNDATLIKRAKRVAAIVGESYSDDWVLRRARRDSEHKKVKLHHSIEGFGGRPPFTSLPVKLGEGCEVEGPPNNRPDVWKTVGTRRYDCTFAGKVTVSHRRPRVTMVQRRIERLTRPGEIMVPESDREGCAWYRTGMYRPAFREARESGTYNLFVSWPEDKRIGEGSWLRTWAEYGQAVEQAWVAHQESAVTRADLPR